MHHFLVSLGKLIALLSLALFITIGFAPATANTTTLPQADFKGDGYADLAIGILIPQHAQNMVSFFAEKVNKWYYVEIGVYE